ncbi:MAG TPA: hypothetical protein VGI19_07505 [Candidatus Cybelea sp.]
MLTLRGNEVIRNLDLPMHVALDIALQAQNRIQKTRSRCGPVNDGVKRGVEFNPALGLPIYQIEQRFSFSKVGVGYVRDRLS